MTNRNSQKGSSLTQILVSIAITGLILTVIVTAQSNQAKENRALTEKLAALDFQRQLTQTLTNKAVCDQILKQVVAPNNTFEASLISKNQSPPTINLGKFLPTSNKPNSPALAMVGQIVSPISNSLLVSSLQLGEIKCPPPCTDPANSNLFTAEISVAFDNAKLVHPMAPAKSQILLQTMGAGSLKTIVGCGASEVGSTSEPLVITCQVTFSTGTTITAKLPLAGTWGTGYPGRQPTSGQRFATFPNLYAQYNGVQNLVVQYDLSDRRIYRISGASAGASGTPCIRTINGDFNCHEVNCPLTIPDGIN